jgi:hypothetical protein
MSKFFLQRTKHIVRFTAKFAISFYQVRPIEMVTLDTIFRATSHTRLRACDHYTSTTLIGGKRGAGPSLLHTVLEGRMENVNARWM